MYIAMDMKSRTYDMGARQQAKTATRDAIIKAAVDTFMAERSFAITLPAVAKRADVTVKTVLRHFGSRDALVDAAWTQARRDVMAERIPPSDDPDAALNVLIAHYERMGDVVLVMLAEDESDPRAHRMNAAGRIAHRAWVEEVFGARLPEESPARSRLIDVLVVATDVYSWKLLRLDRGLSVDGVHDRMRLMSEAILAGAETHSVAVEGKAR
jgi:AcrR family transcriptional regulator